MPSSNGSGAHFSNGSTTFSDVINESKEVIERIMMEEDIMGLSVSVSHKGEMIWSEGFGFSDTEKTQKINSSESLFRIASISKPITTAILASMVEDELINLDASVYKYVPSFPKKKYDINLRQLASHRSGIRHYKWFEKDQNKKESIENGLRKFKKSKLRFEPGSSYLYSSYGYNLLGVAMEKASSETFENLLYERVTNLLGMKHTRPDDGDYSDKKTSGFYVIKKGKAKEARSINLYSKLPCGGILSTSEDLVKFGNAMIYDKLFSSETKEEFMRVDAFPDGKKNTYALGWGVKKDKNERTVWSHTGGNTGSVCRIIIYPEQELVFTIVSNTFGIDYLKFIKGVNAIAESFAGSVNDEN